MARSRPIKGCGSTRRQARLRVCRLIFNGVFVKKQFVGLLLASAFLVPVSAQTSTKTPLNGSATVQRRANFAVPITTKTLANGMQIIVLPDASVPLVTVELAVRNGSFTEPPELNGLSHLYEHMFFKTNHASMIYRCEDSQFRAPELYRQFNCDSELKLKPEVKDVSYLGQIDQLGIVNNGETHEEVVEYYFTTTTPHLLPAMKFIRDAARFPVFQEQEFAQEKEVVIGELDRHMSEPGYYLNHAMLDRLFYKYPSRKSPEGTRETVAAATTDQMRLIQ